MGDPPSTRAVFLMWQGVASNLGSKWKMRMETLEAIQKWGWRPWKQVKNENENRPQAWWEQMVQRRDRREWRWRSCELELSCFPALEGKLFTGSDLEKNMNCSALILFHLVLHLLPSPDPLFSKISRYQDSGKHCPEMTIFRTGSWYAHCSCVCKLHFVHYSHQAGRKYETRWKQVSERQSNQRQPRPDRNCDVLGLQTALGSTLYLFCVFCVFLLLFVFCGLCCVSRCPRAANCWKCYKTLDILDNATFVKHYTVIFIFFIF